MRLTPHEKFIKAGEWCEQHSYILISKDGEIKRTCDKVKFICNIHGAQEVCFESVQRNCQCYWCSRKTAVSKQHRTTLNNRQKNLYERAIMAAKQSDYKIITPQCQIIRNTTDIEYECPAHGRQHMRINNLINGRKCPQCRLEQSRQRYQLSENDVRERIFKCGGTVLNPEDYQNQTCKNLKILCPECHNPFITSFVNFTQHGGQLCKNCKSTESLGARRVRKYLEANNIKYEQEKWFIDCRDDRPLPFDFYCTDLNTVIEFDGRQHFVERFDNPVMHHDTLEYVRRHDEIKNSYCRENGIHIIRIPYTQFEHIEEILDKSLHEDIV